MKRKTRPLDDIIYLIVVFVVTIYRYFKQDVETNVITTQDATPTQSVLPLGMGHVSR